MNLDYAQGTPLHAAAISKHHDIIKILLEHHADVRHQFLCSLLCGEKENSGTEYLVASGTRASSVYSIWECTGMEDLVAFDLVLHQF